MYIPSCRTIGIELTLCDKACRDSYDGSLSLDYVFSRVARSLSRVVLYLDRNFLHTFLRSNLQFILTRL
jgi:hypothetical protein